MNKDYSTFGALYIVMFMNLSAYAGVHEKLFIFFVVGGGGGRCPWGYI